MQNGSAVVRKCTIGASEGHLVPAVSRASVLPLPVPLQAPPALWAAGSFHFCPSLLAVV